MTTLTKADIIDKISSKVDVDINEVKNIVDSIFNEVRDTLESGENVRISGFGNFILRDKVVRPGRNPKTGEDVDISARRVVSFKAGQKLRKRVESTSE